MLSRLLILINIKMQVWIKLPIKIETKFKKFNLFFSLIYLIKKKGAKIQEVIELNVDIRRTILDDFEKKLLVFAWKKIIKTIKVKYTCDVKVFNQTSATIGGETKTINTVAIFSKFVFKKIEFWKIMNENKYIFTRKAKYTVT